MKRIFTSILIAITSMSLYAVKLNQRGEKMVSEIRVDFGNMDVFYTISFGYDKSDDISSISYKSGDGVLVANLKRDENGNITRYDYSEGKLCRRYTFVIDSQKRPIEMRQYEKDIYGKFRNIWTLIYDYDFQDYDLSIINIHNEDSFAQRRDAVKLIDGCVYVSYFGINLKTKKAVEITMNDSRKYGVTINDLNIDPSQIYAGFPGISGTFGPEMQYLSLVQWIPLKSKYLPIEVGSFVKVEYEFDDKNNINRINIIKKQPYSVTITYVE